MTAALIPVPETAGTLYTNNPALATMGAQPKNFAIDFDETYTLNPQMWVEVMKLFHKAGINVYIVTYRYDNTVEEMDLEHLKHYDFVKGIVFTGRKGKDAVCKSLGIHIDVWIDDNPITITHSMVGISPADLSSSFVPDNMKVTLSAPPRHLEQAAYESRVFNGLKLVQKH